LGKHATRVPSRRPLTSRERSPYDQVIPIDELRTLVYRSEFDVSLSGRTQFCRGWVLALSAALSLLSGLKPTRAAGCHVADQPILQSRFSWERDQTLDRAAPIAAYAPPILTHPPCQGDVPHFSNPSSVTSPALLPACTPVQRSRLCGFLAILPHHLHHQPLAFRLDRPPRPL
jgi:hypothetical protein